MKNSSFFMQFYKLFFFIFILILFITIFFIPVLSIDSDNIYSNTIYTSTTNEDFIWPIPGYTYISSFFGKRIAPTNGASTFHKGTDIPAPPGTPLLAVADGIITFTDFLGGGRIYYNSFCFRIY